MSLDGVGGDAQRSFLSNHKSLQELRKKLSKNAFWK